MNYKNLIVAALLMSSTFLFSQEARSVVEEENDKFSFTKLIIETDDLDELINFDWEKAHELFSENDKDAEIHIGFVLELTGKIKEADVSMKVNKNKKGPTSDYYTMVDDLKSEIVEVKKYAAKLD